MVNLVKMAGAGRTLTKAVAIVGAFGAVALAAGAASAAPRPDYCPERHDHRAHDANYYDYHRKHSDKDRRRASFEITFSDRRYDDRGRRYYDNGYRNTRYSDRDHARRVLHRASLSTRYNARIIVKEEIVYRRNGSHLVCTVRTRGPDAEYVPIRRLKRVARNHCSADARVRIRA